MFQTTIISGNLGGDPELRFTHDGTPVCNFSVAVNKSYAGSDGTKHETVTWFRVITWRKAALTCNEWLKKGRNVLVEGEIGTSAWIGDDGKPRATLELTAKVVRFGPNGNSNGKHEPEVVTDEEIPF